ncbi:MAG: hypothetical protein U9N52_10095 [Campylobacterota bacterium]|nr:hypothetical protein [Campylobacterota bacterium]
MNYETFTRQKHAYKNMNEIAPAAIGVRKKVRLFQTLHDSKMSAIVALSQKSRVLLKDVAILESIVEKMAVYGNCNYEEKLLLIEGPLCSKARAALEELGWDIP